MTKENDALSDFSQQRGMDIGGLNFLQIMGRTDTAKANAAKFEMMSLPPASVVGEISAPSNWLRLQEGDNTRTPRLTLRPSINDSTMICVNRHRDLPEATASNTFKTLMARGLNPSESQVIYSEDSRSGEFESRVVTALSAVLGTSMVGDNQLSNPYKLPDPRAPIFHIEKMELKNLNGKTVLAVDGHFLQVNPDGSLKTNAAGKPVLSSYTGIFAPKDSRAQSIEEIYMLSGDKDDFQKNKATFNRMLRSISWQRGQ